MYRLLDALDIPENYICCQRTNALGMEALMTLLRRFAYPDRWCDLVSLFGRSTSELSLIFHKICLGWILPFLLKSSITKVPLKQCWGFIDGTPRPMARPTRNQHIMFSGHKRVHCIKFQSVQAPNGLIANMFGPMEGKRHDAFMLGVSGLAEKLRRFQRPNGEPYIIYGDPAYGLTRNILAPFRGVRLTDDQQELNSRMSKLRVSVEWGFGKICQLFAFLDFKKNLKILLQPIGKYYLGHKQVPFSG